MGDKVVNSQKGLIYVIKNLLVCLINFKKSLHNFHNFTV